MALRFCPQGTARNLFRLHVFIMSSPSFSAVTAENLYRRKLNTGHIDCLFPSGGAEVVTDPEMLLAECYSSQSRSPFWHFTVYLFSKRYHFWISALWRQVNSKDTVSEFYCRKNLFVTGVRQSYHKIYCVSLLFIVSHLLQFRLHVRNIHLQKISKAGYWIFIVINVN